MSEKKKHQILEVTMKRTYIVPIHDKKRTKINGWPLSTVIEDWFKNCSLDSYHATRDGHFIHGLTTVTDIKEKEIITTKRRK